MDLTLSDFKVMLKRKKGAITFFTLLSAVLFLGWGLTRDVRYKAEASFRDKGQASGIKESMNQIFFGGGVNEDSETISGLTSYRMAEKLIKKEGLQLEIRKRRSFSDKVLDNLKTEKAYFLKEKTPSLSNSKRFIKSVGVDYRGEEYLTKTLTFQDDETFWVEDEGEGKLGEVFLGDGYYFILHKDPDLYPDFLAEKEFTITLHPLKPLMKDIKESIVAKSDPEDSTLVQVSFSHPDRQEAARLLNSLLLLYHDFLEEERDRINEAQLSYLQERELGMTAVLDQAIGAHADRIKGGVATSGFTDAKREMEFLESQLIQTNERIGQLRLDQRRFQKILKEGISSFDSKTPGQSDAPIINEMLAKIRELKHLEETLEEELKGEKELKSNDWHGVSLSALETLYLSLVKEKEENSAFQKQLAFLLENFDTAGFEITSLTSFLNDPISQEKISKASKLSHDLKDRENRTQKELNRLLEELEVEKAFLKSHLSQTAKLAKLREKLLSEKMVRMQGALLQIAKKERLTQKHQLETYLKERMQDLALESSMLSEKAESLKQALSNIPEKWVEEERLSQQIDHHRRLSENLASMVETKNISKNLELVQSAPLDFAFAPIHPKPPKLMLLGFLGAFMGLFFSSSYYISQGILKKTPITVKNLSLNGFLAKDHPKRALGVFSKDTKIIGLLNSKEASISSLFKSRGEKVFVIDIGNHSDQPFDADNAPLISPFEVSKHALLHPGFTKLLDDLKPRFDRILIETSFKLSDPDTEAVLNLSEGALIFFHKETYQEISSLIDEVKRDQTNKPLVFIKG